MLSSSDMHHCAWLITCCTTSSDFLAACFVRQPAIWCRPSIHSASASTSPARNFTIASSIASLCPLTLVPLLLWNRIIETLPICDENCRLLFSKIFDILPRRHLLLSIGVRMQSSCSMHVAMLLVWLHDCCGPLFFIFCYTNAKLRLVLFVLWCFSGLLESHDLDGMAHDSWTRRSDAVNIELACD